MYIPAQLNYIDYIPITYISHILKVWQLIYHTQTHYHYGFTVYIPELELLLT